MVRLEHLPDAGHVANNPDQLWTARHGLQQNLLPPTEEASRRRIDLGQEDEQSILQRRVDVDALLPLQSSEVCLSRGVECIEEGRLASPNAVPQERHAQPHPPFIGFEEGGHVAVDGDCKIADLDGAPPFTRPAPWTVAAT